jgi:hypothetical protein
MDSSCVSANQARRCLYHRPHSTNPLKPTIKAIQILVRITSTPSLIIAQAGTAVLALLKSPVRESITGHLDGRESLGSRSLRSGRESPLKTLLTRAFLDGVFRSLICSLFRAQLSSDCVLGWSFYFPPRISRTHSCAGTRAWPA